MTSTTPGQDSTPPQDQTDGAAHAHSRSLHWQILAGLILGGAAGMVARMMFPPLADGSPHPTVAWIVYHIAEPAGQIFLRLIFMIVLPLLFSALLLGVAGAGDVRRLGRMGLMALVFTFLLSAASVVIGVSLANGIRPGDRLAEEQRSILRERYGAEANRLAGESMQAKPLRDILLDIIPRNPLKEMVGAIDGSTDGGGILAVMFFALAMGIAILFVPERTGPLIAVFEGLYDLTMVIVGFAMRLAPIGVAGLMFGLTAVLGVDILRILLWYVLTVLIGLGVHFFGVYSLFLMTFARMSPWRFFARTSDALLTAFATSSSNATLPTAIRVAQEDLGLHREVSNFVLTVGSTANQNGTALYEGVTVLFLAQVFGVDLTLGQQVLVACMCILAGIGTAGVPGGSIPFVAIVLRSVGVPAEGIGIILGVDRLLDMCRTTLNVGGDLAIAACVDRWERRWTARATH